MSAHELADVYSRFNFILQMLSPSCHTSMVSRDRHLNSVRARDNQHIISCTLPLEQDIVIIVSLVHVSKLVFCFSIHGHWGGLIIHLHRSHISDAGLPA